MSSTTSTNWRDGTCPDVYTTQNQIVYTTCAVGVVGIIGSLLVIVTNYGYRRDLKSIRHRILIGFFLANALYSVTNVVPDGAVLTAPVEECGWWLIDGKPGQYKTYCASRGLWSSSTFVMAAYEMFALIVCVKGLRMGVVDFSFAFETAFHILCAIVGIIAIGAWFPSCKFHIKELQTQLDNPTYDHQQKQKAWNEYSVENTDLLRTVILFFLGFSGCLLGVWIYLRYFLYRQFTKQYIPLVNDTKYALNRELWDLDDPDVVSRRAQKIKIVHLQHQAHVSLVQPLEIYMVAYFLFLVPSIVLVSPYCTAITIAANSNRRWEDQEVPLSCDVICELFLACRTPTMVMLYFTSKRHRAEVLDFRTLCVKVWARFRDFMLWLLWKAGCKRTFAQKATRARFAQEGDLVHQRIIPEYSSHSDLISTGVTSSISSETNTFLTSSADSVASDRLTSSLSH